MNNVTFISVALASVLVLRASGDQASLSKYDIPRICAESARAGLLEINAARFKLPADFLQTAPAKDVAEALIKKFDETPNLYLAAWLLQEPTSLSISGAAYLVQMNLAQKLVKRYLPNGNIYDVLVRAASTPATYSSQAQAQAQKYISEVQALPPLPELAEVKKSAPLLCAQYLTPGCTAALRELVDHMGTKRSLGKPLSYYTSLPDVMKRAVLDPRLVQGSAHFALKILKRFQQKNMQLGEAHLFEEMTDSFIKTGSSPQEAEDQAWVLLAIYGARGASVSSYELVLNRENMPVFLGLYIFSAALGVMDHMSLGTGHPYSYPPSVTSRCAMGGPYHFWLPAYLTRYLMKKGHSQKSAVIASHLSAKLYEFQAETATRTPERVYRDKFFNAYNILIQKNFAFTDAGAVWSASVKDLKTQIFPDAGLRRIFQKGRPMPSLTPEELEKGIKDAKTRYVWFHRVIAPDAYLQKYTVVQDVGR